MKKFILTFIIILGTAYTYAQNINPESDHAPAGSSTGSKQEFKSDAQLPQWCLDINVAGGFLRQNFTAADVASQYSRPVNSNIGSLKFEKGYSIGFDAEAGYFFNGSRNCGLGIGLLYMAQYGNAVMDNFHIEYQSVDKSGNVFRQVITANQPITESLKISNFNIPLLFKYKKRFSSSIGFTADAGFMFNLQETANYNTNASFDYEAIYKYQGTQGGVVTVYDNAATPASSDLKITKQQYLSDHSAAEVQSYFNSLKAQGYNVGLGVRPNNNSGEISYKKGSVGFLVRPAVSFYLSDNIAINLGAYYLYQSFERNSGSGILTNKAGDYNSVLSGVSKSANNSYGIVAGVRIFLSKATETTAAPVAAPEETEKEEEETQVEIAEPIETPKREIEAPRPVSISTPLLFDLNRAEIKKESYPVLEEAVSELSQNNKILLIIHGYTDITGKADFNNKLSEKRALSVKKYLQNKGVNPKRLKTVGHGSKSPAASNKTAEGRAKNRRVIMKVKKI
jgi:outer membrane protein OmpA-like peptidoglycan-associated protein